MIAFLREHPCSAEKLKSFRSPQQARMSRHVHRVHHDSREWLAACGCQECMEHFCQVLLARTNNNISLERQKKAQKSLNLIFEVQVCICDF